MVGLLGFRRTARPVCNWGLGVLLWIEACDRLAAGDFERLVRGDHLWCFRKFAFVLLPLCRMASDSQAMGLGC